MKNLFVVNGKMSLKRLAASLAGAAVTLVAGALFSINAPVVYAGLDLPSFAPPVWAFGVVWPVLFLLMAVASYRIHMLGGKEENAAVRSAVSAYVTQLIFNAFWSALFFGFDLKIAAFADLLILLFYAVLTAVRFFRLDKTAGWLFVPYVLWLVFAAALNLAVILLN